MLKIFQQPLAKKDLIGIWHYSNNKWGVKQADLYVTGLAQAITNLSNNPQIGIPIAHVRAGYRLYHFRKHLIVYVLNSTVLKVVRVLGENMDVVRHLDIE